MRTSRSDVQLELRIDGLACRHPAHGRRSAGRSLLAVRCSTNPTAVVPHDVARTSDIDFTRQKGNRVRDCAGHGLGDSHLRPNCMSDGGAI